MPVIDVRASFRWALLQMKEGIPHLVRIKLSQLPKTLHGMYEYALDQIPKEARDVVHRLLMWLLFAPAHLQEAEFAELVAFEFLSINSSGLAERTWIPCSCASEAIL